MPCFVKGPEPVGRQLPARSEQGRFAHRILERFQCLRRVGGHKKTEPVKLRQTPREIVSSFFFQAAKL